MTMWTWWFIAADDEAARVPTEEEGDRPSLSVEAGEADLRALGEILAARYEPAPVHAIDEERSLSRVPAAFLRALVDADAPSVASAWTARFAPPRTVERTRALVEEAQAFAREALAGPGVLVYRET